MTTLDPGASVVFTHGLRCRPRSTALRASRAAPIITDGLDVLVHEVIAAIATAPWAGSKALPSKVTVVALLVRPSARYAAEWWSCGLPLLPLPDAAGAGESLAGNDSSDDS